MTLGKILHLLKTFPTKSQPFFTDRHHASTCYNASLNLGPATKNVLVIDLNILSFTLVCQTFFWSSWDNWRERGRTLGNSFFHCDLGARLCCHQIGSSTRRLARSTIVIVYFKSCKGPLGCSLNDFNPDEICLFLHLRGQEINKITQSTRGDSLQWSHSPKCKNYLAK